MVGDCCQGPCLDYAGAYNVEGNGKKPKMNCLVRIIEHKGRVNAALQRDPSLSTSFKELNLGWGDWKQCGADSIPTAAILIQHDGLQQGRSSTSFFSASPLHYIHLFLVIYIIEEDETKREGMGEHSKLPHAPSLFSIIKASWSLSSNNN